MKKALVGALVALAILASNVRAGDDGWRSVRYQESRRYCQCCPVCGTARFTVGTTADVAGSSLRFAGRAVKETGRGLRAFLRRTKERLCN